MSQNKQLKHSIEVPIVLSLSTDNQYGTNHMTISVKECEIKLDMAIKLTSGLSDEKVRWGHEIENLIASEIYIPGDCLIATGIFWNNYLISYHL